MRINLDRLFSTVAELFGRQSMRDADIGESFRSILASIAVFDDVVIFAYSGEERPVDLFSTFNGDDYEIFVRLYQDGPYLLDPFYRTATAQVAGVRRMRELAPDRFFSSEYYRNYYEKTGLAEEIGFFVPLPDQVTIVLSLMRRAATGPFSPGDFDQLAKAEPLVAAVVRHFWRDVGGRFAGKGRLDGKTLAADRIASHIWGAVTLTQREVAIVELVLQGYSSESIGLSMKIATGTVKVHRRNIYRKLGISSQTQLLSLYLANLNQKA